MEKLKLVENTFVNYSHHAILNIDFCMNRTCVRNKVKGLSVVHLKFQIPS